MSTLIQCSAAIAGSIRRKKKFINNAPPPLNIPIYLSEIHEEHAHVTLSFSLKLMEFSPRSSLLSGPLLMYYHCLPRFQIIFSDYSMKKQGFCKANRSRNLWRNPINIANRNCNGIRLDFLH